MKDLTELRKEIEVLQIELSKKIDSGLQLTSLDVVETSTKLDLLLNEYSTNCRQEFSRKPE